MIPIESRQLISSDSKISSRTPAVSNQPERHGEELRLAQHSQEMLTRLAPGIAHELSSHLQSIDHSVDFSGSPSKNCCA